MFKLHMVEENLMYSIEDKEEDFKRLCSLNEEASNILDSIYVSMLNDKAQLTLSLLEFKWYEALEQISLDNEEYMGIVEDMRIVHKCFVEYKSELHITTRHQLEEIMFISRISDILMEDAIECENLDALWESFYQIERRLKHTKLI